MTFASLCTEQSLQIKEYIYKLSRNCEHFLWCLKTCVLLYALFDSQRLTVEWWMTNQPEKKRAEMTEAWFEKLSITKKNICKLVPRFIVALSRIHCCHWDGTIPSFFIVTDINEGGNNVKRLSVAFETQQWVPFASASGYEIFRTAVNNTRISPHRLLHIFLRF